jgi:hypothetical protein
VINFKQCCYTFNVSLSYVQDENSLLRYVNDTNRSICAFELLPPPVALDLEGKSEGKSQPQVQLNE